jgi:hypothetical protein
MMERLKSGSTIRNLASAAAAALLMLSPWFATREPVASGNAVLCGLLMLAFTAAALLELRDWRSWMNLAPGVWVFLSPWILGFATHAMAALVHILVGLTVSILAVIELCNSETLYFED